MAIEYVRVKDKDTKHEYTIPKERVDPEAHEVLKKDAIAPSGDPLPVKYHVRSGSKPAASAKVGTGSRKNEPNSASTSAPDSPGKSGQPADTVKEN